MRKIIKIILIITLIIGIGAGGYFVFNYFNINDKITKATETVNPFYENIGELAKTTNTQYNVPIDKAMGYQNNTTSLFFTLQNLNNKNKGKYYFEDNIVYSKTNYSAIKDDETFQIIKNYLKVEYEDLVFLGKDENSKIEFIDNSWKVLNMREDDAFTIVLKRTKENDTIKGFEYLNSSGDTVIINDNEYNNVSFSMKQSSNSVIFTLYGKDIDTFNVKEIEENFEGEVLDFIKESLHRFDNMKIDSFNKKEYSHVSGKYYINISTDYSSIIKKKEIVFLQDNSDKVIELDKEIDENTLQELDVAS